MSTLGLCALGVALGGCGQKGPLYLPTDPAASNRATLPSLLRPGSRAAPTPIEAVTPGSEVAPPPSLIDGARQ